MLRKSIEIFNLKFIKPKLLPSMIIFANKLWEPFITKQEMVGLNEFTTVHLWGEMLMFNAMLFIIEYFYDSYLTPWM